MKVILLENIKRVGSIGEIIDVKRGFARNFLIANKKALYASKENINQVEKIKSQLSKKDNDKKLEAKKILEKMKRITHISMQFKSRLTHLSGEVYLDVRLKKQYHGEKKILRDNWFNVIVMQLLLYQFLAMLYVKG